MSTELNSINVSVVVPVYRVEKDLPECVNSILNQTHKNIELILVDDGSDDRCPELCDNFKLKDERVKVVHKKNGGATSARKAGLCMACGEYVLYVDGDDWIDESYIENMLAPLSQKKVEVVCSTALFMNYSDGRQLERITPMDIGVYSGESFIKYVYPNYICNDRFFDTSIPINVQLYLYRKEFLLRVQEQVDNRISMGEDIALTFRILLEANSLAVVNIFGYHYRQRTDSLTHKRSEDHFQRIYFLYKNLKDAVKECRQKKRSEAMEKKIPRAIFFTIWTTAPDRLVGISNEFLFPFSQVKKGSRIFVYGTGLVGHGVMANILNNNTYTLVGCSDQGWKGYDGKIVFDGGKDCIVFPPDGINKVEFDYVIVGVSRYRFIQQITSILLELGIPEEKIAKIDQSLLVEENLPFQEFD